MDSKFGAGRQNGGGSETNERHGDDFIGPGVFFRKSGGSDIIFAAHGDSAPPPSHREGGSPEFLK